MAVVWQYSNAECQYEVRVAGNSRRLYKDGVFHSQWNPLRPLSNGVWDLLFLPALFRDPCSVKKVLVLGVGGGAVLNTFGALLNPSEIVGIELDPIHLKVANEFFLLPDLPVTLHQADAISWVKRYRGKGFDVVIEDLFTEIDGEPVRVAEANKSWFQSLRKLLRPGGTLVVNFESSQQMRQAGTAYQAAIGSLPNIRYHFSQPAYGNSVCAFLAQPASPAKLREQLGELLRPYPACHASAQKFRVRKAV